MVPHLPHYSHRYNLAAKVASFGVGLASAPAVVRLFAWLRDAAGLGPHLDAHPPLRWLGTVAQVGAIGLCVALSWHFLYKPCLVPAANWLFLRRARATHASWADAVALSPLFELDRDAIWFPVPEVLDLPAGQRLAYLYAFAERMGRIAPGHGPAPVPTGQYPADLSFGTSPPASALARDPPLAKAVGRLPDRAFGVVMLIVGGLFGYWGVVEPLLAVARRARNVSHPYEATVATPPVLAFALLYLVLGPRATRLLGMKRGQHPTKVAWLIVVVFLAIGIVLDQWLEARLKLGG
jgi:hypothetical protein